MYISQDNSHLGLKVSIRQKAIQSIPRPAVLDLFCGKSGNMYQHVWYQADKYLGIDKNPHRKASTMQMDNKRAINMLDLSEYNIYDLDAYGSAYHLLRPIISATHDGPYAIIMTDGALCNIATTVLSAEQIRMLHLRGLPRPAQTLIRQDPARYRAIILSSVCSWSRPTHIIDCPQESGIWYFALIYGQSHENFIYDMRPNVPRRGGKPPQEKSRKWKTKTQKPKPRGMGATM